MTYAHCDMSSKNIQKRTIIHAKSEKSDNSVVYFDD